MAWKESALEVLKLDFFSPFPGGIKKYRTKEMGGGGYYREKGSTRAYLLKREKGMTQMGRSGNVVLKQHFFLQKAFDHEGLKLENHNVISGENAATQIRLQYKTENKNSVFCSNTSVHSWCGALISTG